MLSSQNITLKKLGVLTTYKIGDNPYSSYILGDSNSAIQAAIHSRNLNEVVESQLQEIEVLPDFSKLNDFELEEMLPEILHVSCYLSFIALKSKTISLEEVLGDEGIVHEISHYLCSKESAEKNNSLIRLRELLHFLQRNVIGIYEPV